MKKKHSDFYYRLRLLNDKIHIYTSIFYSKVPKYQQRWYEVKKKILEEKLYRQKQVFEEEMKEIEKKAKIQKRAQSSSNVMQLEFNKTKTMTTGRNANILGELKELSPPKTLRLERMGNFKKRAQSSNNVMSLQVKRFNYQPTIEEEDGSSKELRGKKGVGKNMSSN